MTQLLQQAIARVHKLPESEQDTIAALYWPSMQGRRSVEAVLTDSRSSLDESIEHVRNWMQTKIAYLRY